MKKLYIFTDNSKYDKYSEKYNIIINYTNKNNFSNELNLLEDNSIVFTDFFLSEKYLLWINNKNIDYNNFINKILIKKNIKLIKIIDVNNIVYDLFEVVIFLDSLKDTTNIFRNNNDETNNLLRNKNVVVCGNGKRCSSYIINYFDLKFMMNTFFIQESKTDNIKLIDNNDEKKITENNIIWYMGSFKVNKNLNYCLKNNINILSKEKILKSKIQYNQNLNIYYIKNDCELIFNQKCQDFFCIQRPLFTGIFLTILLLSNKLSNNFFLSITGISTDLKQDYIIEKKINGIDYVIWEYNNHQQYYKKENLTPTDIIELNTTKNDRIKYFFDILFKNEICLNINN